MMSRKNYCQACAMLRNGVKSRIALTHTCGLGDGEFPEDMVSAAINHEPQYIYKFGKNGIGILSKPVSKKNLPK